MPDRRSVLAGLGASLLLTALPTRPALAQAYTSKARRQAVRAVARQLYRSEHAIVAANPDGELPVAEFFDYNCHVCRQLSRSLFNLAAEDPGVRIVLREFPVFGPDSEFASRAALAARRQDAYLALHDALMEAPGRVGAGNVLQIAGDIGLDTQRLRADMERTEVTAAIAEGHGLAQTLAIPGTPTYIVDDVMVAGASQPVLAGMVAAVRATRCYTCGI